jgi:hypothetical protein
MMVDRQHNYTVLIDAFGRVVSRPSHMVGSAGRMAKLCPDLCLLNKYLDCGRLVGEQRELPCAGICIEETVVAMRWFEHQVELGHDPCQLVRQIDPLRCQLCDECQADPEAYDELLSLLASRYPEVVAK